MPWMEYWRAQLFSGEAMSPEGLLLELSLPDDFGSPLECQVRCASETEYALLLSLQGKPSVRIRGRQSDIGGDPCRLLEIEDAWITRTGTTCHGNEFRQWLATIECGNTVIRHVDLSDPDRGASSTVYVTDNPWLAIVPPAVPRKDGSISAAEPYPDSQAEFLLRSNGSRVQFLRDYDWSHEGGKLMRRQRLAASIEGIDMGESGSLRAAIYTEVDDFLLLAGLATGSYSQCLGFAAVGPNDISTGYRLDRELPKRDESVRNPRDTVVNPGDLQHFWSQVYGQFCASAYESEIRTCLHVLRAVRGSYLEPAFLMCFAALELLLSKHRDLRGLAYVMDPNQFKEIRRCFERQIRTFDNLAKPKRKAFYGNLQQLNRIPVGEVFEDMVTAFEMDLAGIWPFRGAGGLLALRNLLVHGATVTANERFSPALTLANHHLQWTLEILLLSLLGWPRDRTQRHELSLQALFGDAARADRIQRAQADVATLTAKADATVSGGSHLSG